MKALAGRKAKANVVGVIGLVEGADYDIFDTANSDNEPDEATLSGYHTILWFTGDAVDTVAGPGSAAETALTNYLDGGGCFAIFTKTHLDPALESNSR